MPERRSNTKTYSDTNFQTGDSPIILNVEVDLGRAGVQGFLACDGTGNITVELSSSVGGAFDPAFTIKNGESFDFEGLIISRIRLSHTGTDSAYRVVIA